MNLRQKERNEIAVKIFRLLNKERPKPDIFDCIDIFNNLQEAYVKELEFNTLIRNEEGRRIMNRTSKWGNLD